MGQRALCKPHPSHVRDTDRGPAPHAYRTTPNTVVAEGQRESRSKGPAPHAYGTTPDTVAAEGQRKKRSKRPELNSLAEPQDLVVARPVGIDILESEIKALADLRGGPESWLSTTHLAVYGRMIQAEADAAERSVWVFLPEFWFALKAQAHIENHVSRDQLSCARLVLPMHHKRHFICVCINMQQRMIELYNSLRKGGAEHHEEVFKVLLEGLEQIDLQGNGGTTPWTMVVVQDSPQQVGGVDCGVFVAQTMLQLGRLEARKKLRWQFWQQDVPALRLCMAKELLAKCQTPGTLLRAQPSEFHGTNCTVTT